VQFSAQLINIMYRAKRHDATSPCLSFRFTHPAVPFIRGPGISPRKILELEILVGYFNSIFDIRHVNFVRSPKFLICAPPPRPKCSQKLKQDVKLVTMFTLCCCKFRILLVGAVFLCKNTILRKIRTIKGVGVKPPNPPPLSTSHQ